MRSRDLAIVLPVSQALHCYENCYRFHFLKSSKLSAISVRVQRKPTDWCSFPGRSQQQNNRYTSLVILHKPFLFSLVDLEADFLTEILIFTWDSTVYSVLQQVDVFTGIAKHLFWTANPELQLPEMQPNATERMVSLAEVFVNKALLSNRTPGTLQVSLMMKNKGATVFIVHFLLESL